MKAVVYARVSTEDQVQGTSLDNQIQTCREYCEKKGYAVLAEFREDISGTAITRPELDKAIDLADSYDVLVCYSVDRFAREMGTHAILEREINSKGAQLEFAQGDFSNTPEGKLYKNMVVSFAEFERAQILRRSILGLQARARSGKVTRSLTPPYGYHYEDGYFVIDKEQAEVVRNIFNWYTVHKLSGSEIANRLSKERVPTKWDIEGREKPIRGKGGWYSGTVLQILKHRVYIGEYTFGDIDIEVPAIISRKLFEKAQKQRKANRRGGKRNTQHKYLLSQRLYCTTCGRMMFSMHRDHGRGKVYHYYRCKGMNRDRMPYGTPPTCRGQLRAHELDDKAWGRVEQVLLKPQKFVDAYYQRLGDAGDMKETIDELEQRRDELNKRRAGLLPQYTLGNFTEAELNEAIGALNKQIAEVESDLAKYRDLYGGDFKVTVPHFIAAFIDKVKTLDFDQKRKLIEILDVKVYATRLGNGAADIWIEGELNGKPFVN